MADSDQAPLGELVELTLSSVDKKCKAHEEEVLLCNYMDVYNNAFIHGELDFLRATATQREIDRCVLGAGDIVITKDSEAYDDIGVPALVRENIGGLICGYHLAILRPDAHRVDGAYLFYALQSPDVQRQFHAYANGVTRFGLRKDDIQRVKVPTPSLQNQRNIGRILCALDDKIELNRRINETLETMARALFKSWFVDFDPVRVKMEGRSCRLPAAITSRFPEYLAVIDQKAVPVGWPIRPLGDLIELSYGKSLRKDRRVPGEYPVIGSGGSTSSHVEALVRHPTVVVGRKGTVGSVHWAPRGCWPIDTTYYVAETRGLPMVYVYRLLQNLPLSRMNTDAAVPGLNRTNANRLGIRFGGTELACRFADAADPLQKRIDANAEQSVLLAQVRDALLPKLTSGELRVSDAEHILEDTV